jgi:hypothetical protein
MRRGRRRGRRWSGGSGVAEERAAIRDEAGRVAEDGERMRCPKCRGRGFYNRKCRATVVLCICGCEAGKAYRRKWK